MSPESFRDAAAIALAPSFRERYDFSNDEQFKAFAELTWKAAQALADKRTAVEKAEAELINFINKKTLEEKKGSK